MRRAMKYYILDMICILVWFVVAVNNTDPKPPGEGKGLFDSQVTAHH